MFIHSRLQKGNLGTRGGSRTHTALRPEDFKSSAYAIPPPGRIASCEDNLARRLTPQNCLSLAWNLRMAVFSTVLRAAVAYAASILRFIGNLCKTPRFVPGKFDVLRGSRAYQAIHFSTSVTSPKIVRAPNARSRPARTRRSTLRRGSTPTKATPAAWAAIASSTLSPR